jgi:branched-subunit amino acid ABC-type transport system permease component
MAYFSQQLINAITLGAIYGLIAIGYTMVYGIIGMINFAHGEVFMIGAFIALIGFLICNLIGIGSAPVAILLVLLMAMAFTAVYGDRACRLSALARLVPAGAADLRDRGIDRASELRAARAGRAPQARRADRPRRLHPVQRRRI